MIEASDIAEIAVYPPLGIARVGNAADDDIVFAAEVVGGVPSPAVLRDADGRIRRQGVRFRVYARLKSGGVCELVATDGVAIEWRVSIANLKAGWYKFTNALDLPGDLPIPAPRRNRDPDQGSVPNGRFRLDITPPPRTISGLGISGPDYAFEGNFFDTTVYLGELRTDNQGRLLFLGGRGHAAPRWPGTKPTTFANNVLWFDDVADGPVRARVTIGDRVFEARPAHVSVAPPNYAPGLFGIVTMDDVVRETFYAQGWLPTPGRTGFTRDVWPIFSRLNGLQWVNHGLFVAHGFGSTLDADDPAVLARLTDASEAGRAWRERVLHLFRDPSTVDGIDRLKLPYVYGDAYGDRDDDARGLLPVTATMYFHLSAWARGDFDSDWRGRPELPDFAVLTADEQMVHLERAPLYECLGGPFHPGIELTWIMRRASLWEGPYRLKPLAEGEPARQDFGPTLTPEICLGAGGPLDGVGPGSLTRWLGVPWHTDEASCLSDFEYSPSTYLSMPSYWGARVPNQVLSAEAWGRASDEESPALQRLKHLAYREDWTRDINGRDYYERIADMVESWWTLGMVMPVETPTHLRGLGVPATAHVETGRHPKNAGSNDKVALIAAIERLDAPAQAVAGPSLGQRAAPSEPPRRTFNRGEV